MPSKEDPQQIHAMCGTTLIHYAVLNAVEVSVCPQVDQSDPEVEAADGDFEPPSDADDGFDYGESLDISSPEALAEVFETGRFGDKPFHAGEYAGQNSPKPKAKSHRTLV